MPNSLSLMSPLQTLLMPKLHMPLSSHARFGAGELACTDPKHVATNATQARSATQIPREPVILSRRRAAFKLGWRWLQIYVYIFSSISLPSYAIYCFGIVFFGSCRPALTKTVHVER